ncbi:MAG: ATP-binding protein [Clostridiales Family XIII bacterium]|nr:ATP-binding protein [Clostridiales Family XIII bacterium]
MDTKRYIDQLILFDDIRNDEIIGRISDVLYNTTPETVEDASHDAYYSTQRRLLQNVGKGEITGNYLQDYICRLIAGDQNVFTLMAEAGRFRGLRRGAKADEIAEKLDTTARAVFLLAAGEVKMIRSIYKFDFEKITGNADGRNVAAFEALSGETFSHREFVHKALTVSKSIDATIMLADYYRSFGTGIFEATPAFDLGADGLVPIKNLDPITMDDIVGCESQKQMLINNAQVLLRGLPANNILLYGDSGTGKSSSVKALLNMYSSRGLKMVCVSKEHLSSLPDVMEEITGRGLRFLIFIDDLSFEGNESGYKIFKSIMEGSACARPKNAIFVVTSNRRNIVKEVWNDRRDQDDVHLRDNLQEKRSLADRFGITLVYSEPSKSEYLAIVRHIAKKAGLALPDEELVSEALKWEIRHGGRSGRAARQFVDYCIGLSGLNEKG